MDFDVSVKKQLKYIYKSNTNEPIFFANYNRRIKRDIELEWVMSVWIMKKL